MTSIKTYDDPSPTRLRSWRPMTTKNNKWHSITTNENIWLPKTLYLFIIVIPYLMKTLMTNDDLWRRITTHDLIAIALTNIYGIQEIRDPLAQLE